jgi:hypothetical protein
MTDLLTPTSELEAINLMLDVIGEAPVNTVENTGLIDVTTARQILKHTSREVQLIGWHWNTEKAFTLSPNVDVEVPLPANTLKVDSVYPDQTIDVVQRGSRLYDRENHTYAIGRSVKTDLVVFLAFEELPEAARSYITIRAARVFQERRTGSELVYQFNKSDELRAMAALHNAEADTADYNILSGSESVAGVLRR